MNAVARWFGVTIAAMCCASATAQDIAYSSLERLVPVEGSSPQHTDTLRLLVEAARAGDQAAADTLLRSAYEAAPGARTRTDVFQEAAKAAAAGGASEKALAWADWAVLEAAGTGPERHREALSVAVDVATKVGARRAALDHARRYAGLHPALSDHPAELAARISYLDTPCPDLVGERHIRRSVAAAEPSPGALYREPAACLYAALPGASASDMTLYTASSWQKASEVARTAAAGRFTWFENKNPEPMRGIKPSRTIVSQIANSHSNPTWLVAVEYVRRGDPRLIRSFAITTRSDVLVIMSAVAVDAPWPPDALNAEVIAALQSVQRLGEPD